MCEREFLNTLQKKTLLMGFGASDSDTFLWGWERCYKHDFFSLLFSRRDNWSLYESNMRFYICLISLN